MKYPEFTHAVVCREKDLKSGEWSEWSAIGAFTSSSSAMAYIQYKRKDAWCEQQYKIEEI